MIVKQLMTEDPLSVEEETLAISALDLMVDEGIRHLPVVDTCRCVVGIISIDDLAAALTVPVSLHHRLRRHDRNEERECKVGEVMTYTPDTVLPSVPAGEAALLMVQKAIGCLPVVDEQEHLVGILSETDVLRAFAAESSPRKSSARSPEEHLVSGFRSEQEHLARVLALHDQVGPSLAAARFKSLQDAIVRSEHGTLRSCVRCERVISISRLRALPGTTICGRCAREAEW